MPTAKNKYRNAGSNLFPLSEVPTFTHYFLQRKIPCKSCQNTERAAGKIDPVIVQPLPAADVNGLCAAGVKRVFFGFLFVGGAVIHGLDCSTEEGVEERAGQPCEGDQ